MGELIDITQILKDKEIEKSRELSEKEHDDKLSQNGLICFDRFNEFLDGRKANIVGERYKFISDEFMDQYRGGIFELNTPLSAMAGELTSIYTDNKAKKIIIDAIKPNLTEIIDALQEDVLDLSLLIYEIESMNPVPNIILDKAENLYQIQKDVIELYEIIAISAGCKIRS